MLMVWGGNTYTQTDKMKNKTKKIKNQICLICKKIIYVKRENYVHVIDFFKGKLEREGYFHRQCYLDRLNAKQSPEVQAVTQKAMRMLDALGKKVGVTEEVYV
jgi:hypothetical protein